jgi:hypothetical protein
MSQGRGFPSLNALLESDGNIDRTEGAQAQALEAYQRWWKKVANLAVEQARKMDPLDGTKLHWY